MAPRRGKRDDAPAAAQDGGAPLELRALFAAGRMVGFLLLALPALAVLAGVVLLPAYVRLANAQYELECKKARIADAEWLVAANDRLIKDLPEDEVLTKRLAMNSLGMLPEDETVIRDPNSAPAAPPGVIQPRAHPRPDPPSNWLTQMAQRFENPAKRRGVLLIAACAMLAAMFFFSPPEKYNKAG